jgi:hypothetical protein
MTASSVGQVPRAATMTASSVGQVPRAATLTASNVGQVPRAALNRASGPAAAVIVVAFLAGASLVHADEAALSLRAVPIGSTAVAAPMSIELFRWSTDSERGPLLAALAPPPPAPAPPVNAEPPAAGRAGGRAGGRGGRGGRGGGAAAPASPVERLTGAVKAAPTIGFIWGGITGYAVKYAWHALAADGTDRVVLVTDRRLDAGTPETPTAGDFTVIEMLIDAKGVGEAKTSLTAAVVVDAAARTLALDGYRAAPAFLKVTR